MNFIGAILGWLVWNIAELVMVQKELEEDGDPSTNFYIRDYAKKKRFYWYGSFVTCCLALWIGHNNLNLDPLAPIIGHNLGWNDLYYIGAGAGFEMVIFIISKIKSITKK